MNYRLLKACVSFAMVCFCQQAVMAELKIDLSVSRNLIKPNATNSERIALVGNNLEKLLGATKSEAAELLGLPLDVFKEDNVYLRLTTNISQFEETQEWLNLALVFRDGQVSNINITRLKWTTHKLLAK